MKNTIKFCILVAGMVLVQGCTTNLTIDGQQVRIIDDKEQYEYVFLGTVSGFDTLGANTGAESENAMNEARNRAAALGATAIRVIHIQTTIQGTSVTAEALKIDFTDSK